MWAVHNYTTFRNVIISHVNIHWQSREVLHCTYITFYSLLRHLIRKDFIKIGEVVVCCRQVVIELTADLVCMDKKRCQYNYTPVRKYSCGGMTSCPCTLAQLLRQQQNNALPIFFPIIIFDIPLMCISLIELHID